MFVGVSHARDPSPGGAQWAPAHKHILHTYTLTHTHTHTHRHCTHIRTHARTHGRTDAHTHTRARARTHTHTHKWHTHTHTHTHKHRSRTRTHTHTQRQQHRGQGGGLAQRGAADVHHDPLSRHRVLVHTRCEPPAPRPNPRGFVPRSPSLPPSCPVQADQIDYVGPARFSSVPSPSRWRTFLTSVQFLSFSRFVETKKNSAPFSKSD